MGDAFLMRQSPYQKKTLKLKEDIITWSMVANTSGYYQYYFPKNIDNNGSRIEVALVGGGGAALKGDSDITYSGGGSGWSLEGWTINPYNRSRPILIFIGKGGSINGNRNGEQTELDFEPHYDAWSKVIVNGGNAPVLDDSGTHVIRAGNGAAGGGGGVSEIGPVNGGDGFQWGGGGGGKHPRIQFYGMGGNGGYHGGGGGGGINQEGGNNGGESLGDHMGKGCLASEYSIYRYASRGMPELFRYDEDAMNIFGSCGPADPGLCVAGVPLICGGGGGAGGSGGTSICMPSGGQANYPGGGGGGGGYCSDGSNGFSYANGLFGVGGGGGGSYGHKTGHSGGGGFRLNGWGAGGGAMNNNDTINMNGKPGVCILKYYVWE